MKEIVSVVVPSFIFTFASTPGSGRRAAAEYAWRKGVDVYEPATKVYKDAHSDGWVVVGPVRDLFSNEEK